MSDGVKPVLEQATLERLRGLAEASGDPHLLTRLLSLFIQDTEARLETMRAAAERGDDDCLRTVAHTVRGAAATMGASEIVELCNDLESPADDRSPASTMALLAALCSAFHRAHAALTLFVEDIEQSLT